MIRKVIFPRANAGSFFSNLRWFSSNENVNDLCVMLHYEMKAEVLIQEKEERLVRFTGKVVCLQKPYPLKI